MNGIKIFKIVLLFAIIFVFTVLYIELGNTTWGGWKPPDASLVLNSKEHNWVTNTERKYNSKFNYIGLDDAFQEDSIIYMNINYTNSSYFATLDSLSIQSLTKQLCQSFLDCNNKRIQKYIKFSHNYRLDYLYHKSSDSIVKLKD